MREEEKTNPRVLPIYKPWWLDNVLVDDSWKVADLRKEAERRGMEAASLKKAELIEVLLKSSTDFDLSEKGFRPPVFHPHGSSALPPCYPVVYEGGEEAVALLRSKAL